jgi:mRNA-degrading endonuclease RelE of RelBE toxin-antitoxin system
MPFEIEVTQEAERDLDNVRPFYRRQILDTIESHLQHAPTRTSRSRIKRLRSVQSPEYRLPVGEFRVFYDVNEPKQRVTVLRILGKEEALRYLEGR